MKQIKTTSLFRAYRAPEASLLDVMEEQCFVATTGGLQDLEPNPLYEDDFDDEP